MTPEEAAWRATPGERGATGIVGHLADTERTFAFFTLRLPRDDAVRSMGIKCEAYAAEAYYGERSPPAVVAGARRTTAVGTLRAVHTFAYFFAGRGLHHPADLRLCPGGEPGCADDGQ